MATAASASAAPAALGLQQRRATSRWRQQFWLAVGLVCWLLLLLALLSHHAADPAFSTSGSGEPLRNKAGLWGAWLSDAALFFFGASAWWLVLVGLRVWLAWLALGLRGPEPTTGTASRTWFWAGLALLMVASCGLEWTRLYRLDAWLPGGQAGGVLGAMVGPLSMRWLGFAGSGVLWIAAIVVGIALALQFSWTAAADALGQWCLGLWTQRSAAREVEEDHRIGERALREREELVPEQRNAAQQHSAAIHPPIMIEPAQVEVPLSTRVARERQKPLFVELADTKLPQVDLLDAAPNRVDSVTAESLDMTSRLIEKKLRDFGVEVRVVAASPGPVITRYEIEPATGVKGDRKSVV